MQAKAEAGEKEAAEHVKVLDNLTSRVSHNHSQPSSQYDSTGIMSDEDGCVNLHAPAKRPRQQQQDIRLWVDKEKKHALDLLCAEFFYANGIAFNVARNASFKKFVMAVSQSQVLYTAPGSEALRTTLLDRSTEAVVSFCCVSILLT